MRFYSWLKRQRRRNDPVGDIARDTVIDVQTGCLKPPLSPARIRRHILTDHGAGAAAAEAVRRAVAEWRAEKLRRRV